MQRPTPNSSRQAHTKPDVIIAGGGLAGMVTAIELLDKGLQVMLLDRDEASRLGGLAQWSLGGLFYVNSPLQRRNAIRDSTDLALADWLAVAEFGPNDEWPRRWAEAYVNECTDQVYRWLRGYGLKYLPFPLHQERRAGDEPGNSVPRFHLVWGAGKGLTDCLTHRLHTHPQVSRLDLRFRHKVEQICSDGAGQITGVAGINEATGEPFAYNAPIVVIASGGITGNPQLLRRHWYKPWRTPPEVILNGSHKYGDGALHLAAKKLNANLTHLDKIWNYAAGIHYTGDAGPYEGVSLIPARTALWLNARGERIGPTPLVSGFDVRFLVQEICRQEEKYSWQVLNHKIAARELGVSGAEFNAALREKNALAFAKGLLFGSTALIDQLIRTSVDIVVADSLGELAQKMNALTGQSFIAGDRLQSLVAEFDAEVAKGPHRSEDEQIRRIALLRVSLGDKLRICKAQRIGDPNAGPFIAIREHILARKTMGGLQTDLHSRVLGAPVNGRQRILSGLYAVGEAAGFGGGGIHGLRSLEGTFLGNCVFTARKAAEHIAGNTN